VEHPDGKQYIFHKSVLPYLKLRRSEAKATANAREWTRMDANLMRSPSPGGEPLCRMAGLSDGSKRLPGITQRVRFGLAYRTDRFSRR
jgi:hypothetical protein